MNDKTEGTLVLDGLLEGKSSRLPELGDRLREWIAAAESLGLRFSLETDGNSFSILADNRTVQADDLDPVPSERIAAALNELLKVFSNEEQKQIFSTLRSVEYRRGMEVQTLYAVGPDGKIHTRERIIDASTTPAPRRLTRKEKLRIGAVGLLVAGLVFSISAIFVDYRALFRSIIEDITPLDAEVLKVDMESFKDYFTVEKRAYDRRNKAVVLTLKRGKAFPLNESDFKRLLAGAGEHLSARLTIEALARGYVLCEFYDNKNKFLGFSHQRISQLRETETVELSLPAPRDGRPSRIRISY